MGLRRVLELEQEQGFQRLGLRRLQERICHQSFA